jgi:formylglycine-generating enzyme required for sulfatase activity
MKLLCCKQFVVFRSVVVLAVVLAAGCRPDVDAVKSRTFTNSVGMRMIALSNGIYVSQYEVSQRVFEAVMGNNPSRYLGDELPVETVTQAEATRFCEKLTSMEAALGLLPKGYAYALPSRDEWDALAADASLDEANTPLSPDGRNFIEGKTIEVSRGDVNRLGLVNICGNVSEWSRDRDVDTRVAFHLGPSYNTRQTDTAHARAAATYRNVDDAAAITGFRCVLIPVSQ